MSTHIPTAAPFALTLLALVGCSQLETPDPAAETGTLDAVAVAPALPASTAPQTVNHPVDSDAAAPEAPGNILLFVLDDVGVDKVGLYDAHAKTAPTPTIDGLADEGVVYDRAYATPVCSSTRSTIMTGRHGYRTGIGSFLNWKESARLGYDEVALPQLLDEHTDEAYDHQYIGKWHLGNQSSDWVDHPTLHGWNHFSGVVHGLGPANSQGTHQAYDNWEKTVDGEQTWTTTYVTTDNADDTIEAMATLQEPWVIIVGLYAAHTPYHVPPTELFTGSALGQTEGQAMYNWALEAADTEMGRVLDSDPTLLDRATVMVVGDNGSPGEQVMAPLVTGKGSVFEGGIHVPLIVAGSGVQEPGRRTDALVHTVDLFSTIADLAGVDMESEDLPELDGISFAPTLLDPSHPGDREVVYTERFEPNGPGPYRFYKQTVVGERYKLVRQVGSPDQLFDLQGQVEEQQDLLEQDEVSDELLAILDDLRSHIPVTPELAVH